MSHFSLSLGKNKLSNGTCYCTVPGTLVRVPYLFKRALYVYCTYKYQQVGTVPVKVQFQYGTRTVHSTVPCMSTVPPLQRIHFFGSCRFAICVWSTNYHSILYYHIQSIMKSLFFLAVPVLVTFLNLGVAVFLNQRHAQTDAAAMPRRVHPERRVQQRQYQTDLFRE